MTCCCSRESPHVHITGRYSDLNKSQCGSLAHNHKSWRKVAKRERRRRVRIQKAVERKAEEKKAQELLESNPNYILWQREQVALEIFAQQELERINREENEKWLKAECVSLKQWEELQKKIERARLERAEQEIRIRKEWELEQKKIKETQERLREIEEQNKRSQQLFLDKLELFISGDSELLPEELTVSRESKPSSELCPFFQKTACCRFGDACSRNHIYPGVSKILLATNFYSQFGIDITSDEQGSDIILENDDVETYKEFKEFYYDVLPEFERWGRVVQFKVCNNYERHLRGNTYVEFAELRSAIAAYRALHSRWYAGKQLSLQFCNIASWKNAICGMYLSQRCPKGRACNFLHVFRDPDNLFSRRESVSRRSSNTTRDKENSRNWRWSESPEPDRRRNSSRHERSWSHRRESSRRSSRERCSKDTDRRPKSERCNRNSSKDSDMRSERREKKRASERSLQKRL